MKIRLLFALVGLAISFALPTFAQETNKPDPRLRERFIALIKKSTDARDQNDAAAIAAEFKEDGVLVTPNGPIFGREAIEKHYADGFKQGFHSSSNIVTPDEDSPHIIGTASKGMWATGRWSATIQGKDWGPIEAKGYWSVIPEGDDWKIRMLAFNVTPAPAAKPSPTTTPNNQ
jgi:ketosteroid isomerase-like protein